MTRAIDKLRVNWTKSYGGDLRGYWPIGGDKSHVYWLFASIFNDDFRIEIKKRGYDISTMKFNIERIEKDLE